MIRQIHDLQLLKIRSLRSLILIILLAVTSIANVSIAQQGITTVIFVRHAEKGFDEGGDPNLTEVGIERANNLASILAAQQIDKIYTTPFKRTHQTVQPVAEKKGIDIQEYNPFKIEEALDIIAKSEGQTLLFSGHSNTIPVLINKLLGNDDFEMIDEGEYDNLFVLTLANNQAKLIKLKY